MLLTAEGIRFRWVILIAPKEIALNMSTAQLVRCVCKLFFQTLFVSFFKPTSYLSK